MLIFLFITALNDGLQNTDSGNYRKTINIPTLSIPSPTARMVLWTWDLGYSTVFSKHMPSGINVFLNPLALPLGYLYPIFIFILISLHSRFLHTKVYGFTIMQREYKNSDGMLCPNLTAFQKIISPCLGFCSIY